MYMLAKFDTKKLNLRFIWYNLCKKNTGDKK